MDPRTISYYFIDYLEQSKGYIFCCPNHHTRIIETSIAKLLENDIDNGSHEPKEVMLSSNRESTSFIPQMKYQNKIMESQTSVNISHHKKNDDIIIQENTHEKNILVISNH